MQMKTTNYLILLEKGNGGGGQPWNFNQYSIFTRFNDHSKMALNFWLLVYEGRKLKAEWWNLKMIIVGDVRTEFNAQIRVSVDILQNQWKMHLLTLARSWGPEVEIKVWEVLRFLSHKCTCRCSSHIYIQLQYNFRCQIETISLIYIDWNEALDVFQLGNNLFSLASLT